MALAEDNISLRYFWCWGTLFSARLVLLMRLKTRVSQGWTLSMTTVTKDALGAKAAAEAGRMRTGISWQRCFRKVLEMGE